MKAKICPAAAKLPSTRNIEWKLKSVFWSSLSATSVIPGAFSEVLLDRHGQHGSHSLQAHLLHGLWDFSLIFSSHKLGIHSGPQQQGKPPFPQERACHRHQLKLAEEESSEWIECQMSICIFWSFSDKPQSHLSTVINQRWEGAEAENAQSTKQLTQTLHLEGTGVLKGQSVWEQFMLFHRCHPGGRRTQEPQRQNVRERGT